MKKIAIFGATGMLGQPVTNAFAQSGYTVRALVRDAAKAKARLHPAVTLVEGDLQHQSAIRQVLEGCDYAYISLSVAPESRSKDFQPEREGIATILAEAENQRIQGMGYLSSLVQQYQNMDGFNWWVFELKNQAVRQIKGSDIPSLVFYPSTFMENFDQGNYRQGNRIALAGKSEHPMHFIAGRDYAIQVVRAFDQFQRKSKAYVIQGPEAYRAEEAANLFVKHYEREKLTVSKLPYGVLAFLGNFTAAFQYGAKIVKALNRYPEKFEAADTWEALGKPKITLQAYAEAGGAATLNGFQHHQHLKTQNEEQDE